MLSANCRYHDHSYGKRKHVHSTDNHRAEQETDLPPDLLTEACLYLPVRELIPLLQVYPLTVSPTWFQSITDRLAHHGFGDDLLDVLRQSKGVISGSFIPDTLTGNFSYSDIDVYILRHRAHERYDFSAIEEYLWQRCEERNRDEESVTLVMYPEVRHHMDIGDIRAYTVNGIRVQVISVRAKSTNPPAWLSVEEQEVWRDQHECNVDYRDYLYSEISRTFDFPFVMNSYDGDTLQVRHPESIRTRSGPNLEITRLPSFDPTLMTVLPSWPGYEWPTTTHVRCLKYLARGYRIPNFAKPAVIRVRTIQTRVAQVKESLLKDTDAAWDVRFEVDEENFADLPT